MLGLSLSHARQTHPSAIGLRGAHPHQEPAPLTLEHVLSIVDKEQPIGVVVQLGGQTPLKLARGLEAAGVPILGTPPDAIDLAEDRKRFGALLAPL